MGIAHFDSSLNRPVPISLSNMNKSPKNRPPLVYQWDASENPLPVKPIRGFDEEVYPYSSAPPWITTGALDEHFDYGLHLLRLCIDVVDRCNEFAHIDMKRILVGVTQARNNNVHGLQARVTPLRFPGGELTQKDEGITYHVQRYVFEETEFYYLMTFCLPRYANQDFDNKLITIFHELYHISPAFDGDLRRHEGQYEIHGESQREYDEQMAGLAREYLSSNPDPELLAFLRLNFAQLEERHASVVGVVVPRPQIVPIIEQTEGEVATE